MERQSFNSPSSSGGKDYTTVLHEDGLLACNCKGYTIKRKDETGKDKPKSCKHTEKMVKQYGLATEVRGEFVYAVEDGQPRLFTEEPHVDHESQLITARAKGYVNPQLASAITKGQTVADFPGYIGEIKYDGERTVLSRTQTEVLCWSRPKDGQLGKSKSLPPHIMAEAVGLPDCTIDGELLSLGMAKSYKVRDLAHRDQLVYVVFDVMKVQGQSVMDRTYLQRREILATILNAIPGQAILLAEQVNPTPEKIKDIMDNGGEGVILKHPDSIYQEGFRNPQWRKIKVEVYVGGTITGYEKGKMGPYSKVVLRSDEGIETTCKTKDNSWLKKFAAEPDKYLGQRLIFKHYGKTDDKYRGPIIWDHFAGEGE